MAVSSDAKHLLVESWTLYGVTILVFTARMYDNSWFCGRRTSTDLHCRMSRRLLLGSWKKLQIDDYLMMGVIVSLINLRLIPPRHHLCEMLTTSIGMLHGRDRRPQHNGQKFE